MTKKERYDNIVRELNILFPNANTELKYKDSFQLLVAVILSAQCTDARVNMVTPPLFAKYPTCYDMAKASQDDIFAFIRSVSYPNSKSRYLVECSRRLVEHYNGEIPSDTKELETLSGVGRKTANVIAAIVFNQAKMPVDTHIHRVSARLGLTSDAKTPVQTEEQLEKNLKNDNIPLIHHQLLLFGRLICQARKPKCNECSMTNFCKYFAQKEKESRMNKKDKDNK